jgi:hypothetical protein
LLPIGRTLLRLSRLLLFGGPVTSDSTACGCPEHTMMTCNVPGNATDRGAFQTTLRLDVPGQHCQSGKNTSNSEYLRLHGSSPVDPNGTPDYGRPGSECVSLGAILGKEGGAPGCSWDSTQYSASFRLGGMAACHIGSGSRRSASYNQQLV